MILQIKRIAQGMTNDVDISAMNPQWMECCERLTSASIASSNSCCSKYRRCRPPIHCCISFLAMVRAKMQHATCIQLHTHTKRAPSNSLEMQGCASFNRNKCKSKNRRATRSAAISTYWRVVKSGIVNSSVHGWPSHLAQHHEKKKAAAEQSNNKVSLW